MKVKYINGVNVTIGVTIGQVIRGEITEPIPLILENDSSKDKYNVMITGTWSKLNQMGLPIDTIKSTLISLDGKNGDTEQIVNIPAGGELLFYIQYQPTWLAYPRNYQWTLLIKELNF